MADDPFPKWNEPATKGDVLRTLSATSTCMTYVYLGLLALKGDDTEKFNNYMNLISQKDDELRKLIYAIGGGESPYE